MKSKLLKMNMKLKQMAQELSVTKEKIYNFLKRRNMPYKKDSPKRNEGLTPQENRIMELIARGFELEEIAKKLCISITTVKTHYTYTCQKYMLTNSCKVGAIRTRAVLKYLKSIGKLDDWKLGF